MGFPYSYIVNYNLIAGEVVVSNIAVFEIFVTLLYRSAWRGGRVAEGNGLLNRRTGIYLYRGFESRPLRLASLCRIRTRGGMGEKFPHVVGVTGASTASDARGAEPLWKFGF